MIRELMVLPLSHKVEILSGYFILYWVKVCLRKMAFSYVLSQFYELAF